MKEISIVSVETEERDFPNLKVLSRDYWELTKPRLTFLVLVTTFVGFWMASKERMSGMLLLNALLGTALVAAGAAVLNQFIERNLDSKMVRTLERPLPGKRVEELDVLIYGTMLSVIGLAELFRFVNVLTGFLGLVTLIGYLFIYTPLKRLTPLCTLVGAVPGALPPVMGWTAVTGQWDAGAGALFFILFFWQMPHFYALAKMYREDYERGGFPMLSVVDKRGIRTHFEIILYSLFLVASSLLPYLLGMTGLGYLTVAVLLGLVFLGFAIRMVWRKSLESSRGLFFCSIFYLPLLLAMMIANRPGF
jgi:protoheme IX farnesyltransferase